MATTAPAPTQRAYISSDVPVFRSAAAVIALAIGDDAFVHPEPGTSAVDHLAGGLVPIAVVIAAAVAYPHLCAGLRGSLALAFGLLAVEAGSVDGMRHVVLAGPSGDDLTACLAVLAGTVLIASGALSLWRARRRDEPPARRYARRALVVIAAAVAVTFVVVPLGMAILATHVARAPVPAAALGAPYRPVTFAGADGLRLAGWYVPSRNGAAVIVAPGRSPAVQRHARMLVRHGYGVLLFDRRGEGRSQGDANLYGWTGDRDLLGAVAFLRRRPDVRAGRIGGLGLSVGGETLLQTAAETTALRAVVSEGAGRRSLREHLNIPGLGAVQRWVTPWIVQTGALAVTSNSAPPPYLGDLVRRIAPRPVLLIRALNGHDDERLNRAYYDAALEPKALWEVASGGHTGALEAVPREYEARVTGFFDRALAVPPNTKAER